MPETHEARLIRLKVEDVDLADEGSTFKGWAEAFTIFAKYEPEAKWHVCAEHDEVLAGPEPCTVSDEDILRLAALGWHDTTEGGFRKFT